MIYAIDTQETDLANVRRAFSDEDVVSSSDWTRLAGRLALADADTDVLILGRGTGGDELWRLLGLASTRVPTVIWTRRPESVSRACTAEVVDRREGVLALVQGVERARSRAHRH
tara:strand:- start:2252 stop:2593 length:342 start_codon:yes stop_codon:yes gene_type:complete